MVTKHVVFLCEHWCCWLSSRPADRQGWGLAGLPGQVRDGAPFCSHHELLSTSGAHQALTQLANITVSPRAMSFCHPPVAPAGNGTQYFSSHCSISLPSPSTPEMPTVTFSVFLCHPLALMPGPGCHTVTFPSSSVLAALGQEPFPVELRVLSLPAPCEAGLV